jgi:hypothetical protein
MYLFHNIPPQWRNNSPVTLHFSIFLTTVTKVLTSHNESAIILGSIIGIGGKMKQLTMRVDGEIAEAFYKFCDRLRIKPYDLLSSIVDFYGRAEILTRKVERRELTRAEVLIELGRIVADMKKFANANGEFKKAIGDMLEPHGIKFDELGVI